eukprot:jgi/Astpho2/4759/Aster-00309
MGAGCATSHLCSEHSGPDSGGESQPVGLTQVLIELGSSDSDEEAVAVPVASQEFRDASGTGQEGAADGGLLSPRSAMHATAMGASGVGSPLGSPRGDPAVGSLVHNAVLAVATTAPEVSVAGNGSSSGLNSTLIEDLLCHDRAVEGAAADDSNLLFFSAHEVSRAPSVQSSMGRSLHEQQLLDSPRQSSVHRPSGSDVAGAVADAAHCEQGDTSHDEEEWQIVSPKSSNTSSH